MAWTLRPPAHRVGPPARRWWTAQALLVVTGPAVLAATVLLVLSLLFFPGALPWLAPLVVVGLVVPALGYALAMPALRYRAHAWEVGESALYASSGWYRLRRRVLPLARVESVALRRGPLQRRFGLATVAVTTASSAADVRITGVSGTEARRLADRLRAAAGLPAGEAA
ncbi:hypothetical protein BLA24_20295 [Streptomyces cinnamoneus]|uniref:YdbS-like PH domain-containing protein n=1 Tax=Streptomyces cinnamoneus TaxID=53446 RepID=A0A2G1XFE2_STRCJ|nr:PH domain-containing protein [Streptomyces cinnamoneus]PHQ49960.1 hypothetical protein BLA24_20295 [Streptomyces cinnamoneus]PPT13262.1 hypothetical protein CYQ11_10490 [Streptomyces cinnamoneus]